jgi:hypothetical protein
LALFFGNSLQHIFGRIADPIQGFLAPDDRTAQETYAEIWDCYASGQMSAADLEREIADDPGLAAYLRQQAELFH